MATEQADPGASAFPVDWDDPADAELSWEHDSMHMPFALSPLSIDYVRLIMDGIRFSHEVRKAPFRLPVRFVNGYTYMAVRYVVPEPHGPALDAYTEQHRAFIAESEAYWADTAMPEIEASRAWFRSIPVATMPLDGLADAWAEAWERSARSWQIHFIAIRGAYQITDDLSDFYESVVTDAPPGAGLRLIQGQADVLHEVEVELDRLTAMVRSDPTLRAAFGEGAPPTMEQLAAMPAAADFMTELRGFLDAHGHLGGSFDDIAFPSWAEEPSMVLGDLARRLSVTDGPTAIDRRATLLAEAEAEADRLRALLTERSDELARFEALLEAGRAVGPLTEVHNYWIDRLTQSQIRSLGTRVGERLVTAGVVDRPEDVLYLDRTEVSEALREPHERRTVIAERRMRHEQQRAMRPPATIGKPALPRAEADRFDGARFEATEDGTLRGTGASGGVVRGVARIMNGPSDFWKLTPGDIIVAPSSNPSWVPLFTVAGGALMNTGGVMCHAAVVAREVGLPAVVGLGDATTRIPDGATVELDGTTGLVRVL
jgi:phosphohistidine swiveling domain-containing protein